MGVIATLGDAPTTAIAAVAILLGLLFAARGPRDKRAAARGEVQAQAGPSLLSVPVAAAPAEPAVDPGFVGPEGTVVGHGPIRLGHVGPLGASQAAPAADVPTWAAPPAPVPAPADAPAPEPVVDAEPAAPAEPAPAGEAESAFPGQPEAAEPQATEPAPADPAAAEPPEPAWRRHMPKPAGFRHGGIKLGGKPVGKPPED
jgi:hypothetical protein